MQLLQHFLVNILIQAYFYSRATSELPVNPVNDQYSDIEGDTEEGIPDEEQDVSNDRGSDEEDIDTESHIDVDACATLQDVFRKTHGYFAKKFCTVEKTIKWQLNLSNDAAKRFKLRIETDLAETWLGKPKASVNESVGTWGSSDLSFKLKGKWVPEQFIKNHPSRIPFNFDNSEDEEYFHDKFDFTSGKKIQLPTCIFSPNSTMNTDSSLHLFEYWGRMGLLDSEITHNILDLNKDMIASNLNVLNDIDVDDGKNVKEMLNVVISNMENILNFNGLAVQSNYRAKSFLILSTVKAKFDLRSQVLDKFEGDDNLIEKLQYSNFYTKSLFGPVSEELYNKPGCSNRRAPLQAKVSQPVKRQASQRGNKNKRARYDHFNYDRVSNNSFNYGFNESRPKNFENRYEPRYASQSVFPKVRNQRGASQTRGRRGSKR